MRTLKTAFLIGLALIVAGRLPAQTTFATVTGTVTDSSGAVVPGVKVTAVAVDTNASTTAQSNASGVYTIAQLKEGKYTVRAQAAGFKDFVANDVLLASRDTRRIDVRLEVGAVDTAIEVSAGATLIETETARISDVKGANALKSLPMNTRTLWNFLALSPNVLPSRQGTSQRRFAGSRTNQSDASMDGVTASDLVSGSQISPLVYYIESFQEVRVDMANNTAEFGALGQVQIVSKSGTNRLHGSVMDYYSTTSFRARNPFSPEKGTSVTHQPGIAVGGPVFLPKVYDGRNKTFFFASWEETRGSAVQQLLNPTVPIPAWRQGDFSALAPGTTIRDPFSKLPFPGNRIPAGRLNPVSLKIQERFYPLPNYGDTSVLQSQNYRELRTRPRDPNVYKTARIDHRFSDKSFMFGRFTNSHSLNNQFDGNLPTIGQKVEDRSARNAVLSYSHSLRPTLLNEIRWGLAFNNMPSHGAVMGKPLVQELGLTGLASDLPDVSGIYRLEFSGVGITGLNQQRNQDPRYRNMVHQFQEQLSWFHGRHGVKAGVNVTRVGLAEKTTHEYTFGYGSFSNRFTNHPYADFLLGIPTTARRAFPSELVDRWRWAYDAFVTDAFKVTPKLTLDMGLRYELHPSWVERNNRLSIFDVEGMRIVIPDGASKQISPLMPAGYINVVEAGKAGMSGRYLLNTDKNNFAPRIGIAWRPFGDRTVLRAGYGIFYDVGAKDVNAAGVPFVLLEPAYTNPSDNPNVIFPNVFPASVQGPTSVSLPGAVNPHLVTPYSMQYNFTIQHQRWNNGFRLSYIGTNTRKGEYSYNINQPVADTRNFVDKARRFPTLPAIGYYTNGAGHQYNALTAEAQRQMSSGLQYQVSYSLARDIGDLERGESPENAYDRRRERGVWQDIPTHRITGNLVYELPFGKGKPFFSNVGRTGRLLANGWELSVIYTLQSGQFLTPQWTGPDPTGTAYTTSRTPAQVTIRPNHLRNANLPADQRSVNRWFDPTAFAPPTPGSFGTSAPGVIIGPGANVWHAGISKKFEFGERANFRWETTATNVFNHPNWSNPGSTNISSLAQVGVISGVAIGGSLDQAGARSLRMSFRLEW